MWLTGCLGPRVGMVQHLPDRGQAADATSVAVGRLGTASVLSAAHTAA